MEARERAVLSQRQLGQMIGKNQGHISKLEGDVIRRWDADEALKLAEALSVSAAWLLWEQ